MTKTETDAGSVWVVDDHRAAAEAVADIARGLGYRARTFSTAEQARAALLGDQERCDALITDLRLPGQDGMGLLNLFRRVAPEIPVAVITAHGSIDQAVRAVHAGAVDFLTKPLAVERVEAVIRNAVARGRITAELERVRAENRALRDAGDIVYRSAAMAEALEAARRAADSDASVLLLGESGTGKERVARAIHEASARSKGPFVATHIASLASGVLESELFGHEKGAFTGAAARRLGLFEQARGGTIFLDEVGEIDARTQVKLLRVLQERSFMRVGGSREVEVDARVVAATNRDLLAEVTAGRFRDDLYYRLVVVQIRLPPLRARRDDIPLLLAHFLDRIAAKYGRPIPEIGPEVASALMAYDWPGNVRELENLAERLVVMRDRVTLDDLPVRVAHRPSPEALLPQGDVDLTAFLEQLEQAMLRRALARADGNKAQAARSLSLSRETLRYKLGKYGLE